MNQLVTYNPDQVRDAQSTLTSAPLKLLPKAVARDLAASVRDDAKLRDDLVRECNIVLAANQPATSPQMVALVRRLMNHYRVADMSDADFQGVIEDWLYDLANSELGPIPFDIIRDAMSAYRQSEKARFKPMAGEILANCSPAAFRLKLAQRAAETLELIGVNQ